MDRPRIERQLKLAEQQLAAYTKLLDQKKVAPEERKKHPKWRQLEADVRALKRRLKAILEVEARDAEVLTRKETENAEAGAAAE